MVGKAITITGRVQGVNFRSFAKQKADELGVVGFVRNESDGSVYIEAEGEAQAMHDFLEAMEEGPSFADVDAVATESIEPRDLGSFTIQWK